MSDETKERELQSLRNRLARVERELRIHHERELEEACACDMCVRLYEEDMRNGVTEAAMSDETKERKILYGETDARVWAKEFVQQFGGDEELMFGWFANAIESGRDAGERAAERRVYDALKWRIVLETEPQWTPTPAS